MPRRSGPRPYHKKVAHYYGPDGKRCRSSDPGALKRVVETATFYADFPGARDTPLGTSNEAEAWAKIREVEKRRHDEALGIRDQYSEHAKAPLLRHVEAWKEILAAKGTSATQIALATGRLLRLAEMASWKRLPQIDTDSALMALAKVRADPPEGLGKSAATRNHYLGHLKAFVAWCHDGGRLRVNPVRRIKPINTETDRRHARRLPKAEEISALCAWLSVPNRPMRRGLSASERRLGYLVSAATGLRAGELRSLLPASFRLDEGVVRVGAAYSKRRRLDAQNVPTWLVEELRAWFASGGGWNWHGLDRNGAGKILKADLRDCRADWIAEAPDEKERRAREESDFLRARVETPEGPRFWDYHSLRHAYVTGMSRQEGMDLKTLLALTRLSSAELALKTYSHADEQRMKAAVENQRPPNEKPSK